MLLIQECELWLSNFSCGGSEPQPKRATQPTDKQSSSTLWSLFDEMLADSEDCSEGEGQSRNTAEIMVDMYLKEPVLARSERIHPLTYWLGNKTLWPCLVDLACKYLSTLFHQNVFLAVQLTLCHKKEIEYYQTRQRCSCFLRKTCPLLVSKSNYPSLSYTYFEYFQVIMIV